MSAPYSTTSCASRRLDDDAENTKGEDKLEGDEQVDLGRDAEGRSMSLAPEKN